MAKVPQHLEVIARDLKIMFSAVASDMQLGKKELAHRLGALPMDVSYWCNPDNAERHMPAYQVPEMCRVLEDFRLLDLLEHAAGRADHLVFVPHSFHHLGAQEMKVIQSLVREVGEALQTLADTLEDGIVQDHEYPTAIRELDDVIRECAKLKHWLKERLEVDRQKASIGDPLAG